MAIKILIGGSPCTYWSIAQTNGRETQAEGMGWELFKNYLIALDKFKPDFFLYENNKSASQAIKDQISHEFGVGVNPDVRFTYINSALVSAQNRQRFYVTNFGDIEQPEDRGILLRDILETGDTWREKSLCCDANYFKATSGTIPLGRSQSSQRMCVAEQVDTGEMIPPCGQRDQDKARTLTAGYANKSQRDLRMDIETDGFMGAQGVVEAVNTTPEGKSQTIKAQYQNTSTVNICCYHSTYGATGVAEPIKVGALPRPNGELSTSQAMQIHSIDGKSTTQMAGGGGLGGKTGLYAIPVEFEDGVPTKAVSCADGKTYTVYEVKNGLITIKGKEYPIKLKDGYYIIRKLTVRECARLQTMDEIVQMLYLDLNTQEVVSEKCFAHPRTDAPFVEGKCHRLQKLVESAQSIDLHEFARFVASNSSIRHPQTSELALLNVHTNYEGVNNPKGCSKVLLSNANTVEQTSSYLANELTGDFVQAIVGINLLLQRMQRIGEVELHLKGKPFAVVTNGKMQFTQCGAETIQRAKDVVVTTKEVEKIFTSIISEVSQNTKIYEQMLITLFCYVLNAIGGYILTQTNGKILFSINLPYTFAVSDSQAYKALGNGWTAEVIIHLLNHALKDVPRDEEIVVLSMYDGIATGRYCLDKMGFTNVTYHAYEIDKYPIKIALDNYPDIIEHGDAFAVREDDWKPPQTRAEWLNELLGGVE